MYDICHYERLKNAEIGSNIKIIPKIRPYITENCALHFSNKKSAQFEFTYRMCVTSVGTLIT